MGRELSEEGGWAGRAARGADFKIIEGGGEGGKLAGESLRKKEVFGSRYEAY